MARPREFDENDALDGAMDVFWTHGFENSSLPALLEGMQLTRGSLYKAFADKKNLFLMVMEKYEKAMVAPVVELLTDPAIPYGTKRIEQLFDSVLETVRNGDYRGCLLCTTAAGAASVDQEIADKVHELISDMQRGFEVSIGQSVKFRSADKQVQQQLANHLVTQYTGLRILARSRVPIELLEQSVDSVKLIFAKPEGSDPSAHIN